MPKHFHSSDRRREAHVDLHHAEGKASLRHYPIVTSERHHAAAGDGVAVERVNFRLGISDLTAHEPGKRRVEGPHLLAGTAHQRRQVDAGAENRLVRRGDDERMDGRIPLRLVHQLVGFANKVTIDGVVALGVDKENVGLILTS